MWLNLGFRSPQVPQQCSCRPRSPLKGPARPLSDHPAGQDVLGVAQQKQTRSQLAPAQGTKTASKVARIPTVTLLPLQAQQRLFAVSQGSDSSPSPSILEQIQSFISSQICPHCKKPGLCTLTWLTLPSATCN